MTLYRAKRDGKPIGSWCAELERVRVGQIRLATGEYEKRKAQKYDDLLSELYQEERLDILAGLKNGNLNLRQVYAAKSQGRLGQLPKAETLQRLDAVRDAWVKEAGSPHTAEGRKFVLNRLLRMQADATLADLPGLCGLLRSRLSEKPRSFNHIYMTARALVRDRCGERSDLYREMREIRTLKYRARKVHPFSRAELREIMDWLGPIRGRMLWTLCLTGMRPGEYWGRWEVDGPLIRVHGTKTAGSERIVPLIEDPATPACTYTAFRVMLGRYPGGRVRPYRARHTYAHWAERARVPRSRRQLYLGHSTRSITDDYEWSEVQHFVKRDAERMRRFLQGGRVSVRKLA